MITKLTYWDKFKNSVDTKTLDELGLLKVNCIMLNYEVCDTIEEFFSGKEEEEVVLFYDIMFTKNSFIQLRITASNYSVKKCFLLKFGVLADKKDQFVTNIEFNNPQSLIKEVNKLINSL